jgi:hypothetical protein
MQARPTQPNDARKGPVAGAVAAVGIALSALVWIAAPALGQPVPQGALAPGDAVVTGFSGSVQPTTVAPFVDPRERTFIDVNGAALRVIGLQDMGGPAQAQLVNAPKRYVATAAQIGQVFAVALDNAVPPNIYAAATSVYGLPIVQAGADGRPRHVRTGTANARFMPGLWGPSQSRAGPGSIWKINGATGAVSLFANVTLNGVANSGSALGGLAFDPDSDSLFVADRETGIIHRFNMNGAEIGRYDHGVEGRAGAGLTAVPGIPSRRLNIASPQFDSEQPATWNFAPPERRIFGLGVRAGRLYYAVADGLQIWSVSLARGGPLQPTLEISVPPASGPTEISKIVFDDMGRMFLAERPDPIGAYDFEALTTEGLGRILRYELVAPYPGAARTWQPDAAEYAVGFPLALRNGNGGVAIGYNYDSRGVIDRDGCGSFLWSTGEQLRQTVQPALSLRLSLNGPPHVDGLQGNAIWMVRPNNIPPLATYFVDHDDRFEENQARGHLGDIAIWRPCGPLLRGGWMWPGWMVWWSWGGGAVPQLPPPDKVDCPPDQQQPGFRCCPQGSSPGANGQCTPWCPNGAMDAKSQNLCGLGFDQASYDPNDPGKLQCIGGGKPDPAKGVLACVANSRLFGGDVCPAGWSKQNVANVGMICMPTAQQLQCGLHQQVSSIDNKCHNLCQGIAWPARQCCPPGSVVSVTGTCCPPGAAADPKTGQCRPPATTQIPGIPTGSDKPGTPCPSGAVANLKSGACEPPPPPFSCIPSQSSSDGTCCPAAWVPNKVSGGCCPPGQTPAAGGSCQPQNCPAPGKLVGGKCCSPTDLAQGGACATESCGEGRIPVGASNACCDRRQVYTDAVGAKQCCPQGKLVNGRCAPSGGGVPALPGCKPGTSDPNCCADGYKAVGNSCCRTTQITSLGICCPAGQLPSGANKSQCAPTSLGWVPFTLASTPRPSEPTPGQCCQQGLIPIADGSCCPPERANALGVCCPAGQAPDGRRCVPATRTTPVTPREPPGVARTTPVIPETSRAPPATTLCPRGTRLVDGSCVPTRQPPTKQAKPLRCRPGMVPNLQGTACVLPPTAARPGVSVTAPSVLRAPQPPRPPPPPPVLRPAPAPPQIMLPRR